MRKTEDLKIDGKRYRITQMKPVDAHDGISRVAAIFAPVLSVLAASVDGVSDAKAALSKANVGEMIKAYGSASRDAENAWLRKAFATNTSEILTLTIDEIETEKLVPFRLDDLDLAGLTEWFLSSVTLNYVDFFVGLTS